MRKRRIIRDSDTEDMKEKGNKSFLDRNYQAAIIHYTSALKKSSNESILYSNRSRCHYMLKDYSNSIKDAKIAIDLDLYNIKAYLLYSRGLANLSKQGMNCQEAELALRCCNSALQVSISSSQPEYSAPCKSLKAKLKILIYLKNRENHNYQVSRLENYYKDVLKHKRGIELFGKFVVKKNYRTVPDVLCCPITFEIFSHPVITECGNTYECNALITHFTKMGVIDPIARRQINPHAIINNNSIAAAKKWFWKIEPWTKISETLITSLDIEF